MYTFEDGPHFMESTQHVHIEHEPAERSFEKKPFFLQKNPMEVNTRQHNYQVNSITFLLMFKRKNLEIKASSDHYQAFYQAFYTKMYLII